MKPINDGKIRSHLQRLKRYLARRSVSAISDKSRGEAVAVLAEIEKILRRG